MIIEYWKSKQLLEKFYEALINKKYCTVCVVADKKAVFVPAKKVVDEQLCYDLGYMVYESLHCGGVIVSDEGDIDIAYFSQRPMDFHVQFANAFVKWLKSKGLNATYSDNDILIDDYKICGIAGGLISDVSYTVIHIGINTNIENIKKICTKPMKKIPKGLSSYGIATEEVVEMFKEFCDNVEVNKLR